MPCGTLKNEVRKSARFWMKACRGQERAGEERVCLDYFPPLVKMADTRRAKRHATTSLGFGGYCSNLQLPFEALPCDMMHFLDRFFGKFGKTGKFGRKVMIIRWWLAVGLLLWWWLAAACCLHRS